MSRIVSTSSPLLLRGDADKKGGHCRRSWSRDDTRAKLPLSFLFHYFHSQGANGARRCWRWRQVTLLWSVYGAAKESYSICGLRFGEIYEASRARVSRAFDEQQPTIEKSSSRTDVGRYRRKNRHRVTQTRCAAGQLVVCQLRRCRLRKPQPNEELSNIMTSCFLLVETLATYHRYRVGLNVIQNLRFVGNIHMLKLFEEFCSAIK